MENKVYENNWELRYEHSEEAETLNRFGYGLAQLEKLIKIKKRGLITKDEYEKERTAIENTLLQLNKFHD